MIYDGRKVNEQYQRDGEFAVAVDTIYQIIRGTHLTPEELRKAVWYASYRYEMEHPRPIYITSKEQPNES